MVNLWLIYVNLWLIYKSMVIVYFSLNHLSSVSSFDTWLCKMALVNSSIDVSSAADG